MLELIHKTKFWVLLVAVVYFVADYFVPGLPFTQEGLLAFVMTVLALFGVHTEFMYRRTITQLERRGLLREQELFDPPTK